eukprot:GHVO01056575.1.p3 GENE.GHVO01056575.1~~GHVO01056575.1.p3  ORF type:complete len:121 (+),score=21.60 GHVO01056575.1:250-612(+)
MQASVFSAATVSEARRMGEVLGTSPDEAARLALTALSTEVEDGTRVTPEAITEVALNEALVSVVTVTLDGLLSCLLPEGTAITNRRAAKRRLGEMLRERGYAPRQVRVAGHRTIVWGVVP